MFDMNSTEFRKTIHSLRKITGRGKDKCISICTKKVDALDNSTKNQIIDYLVRENRTSILKNFLNEDTDRSWLASMGYMYSWSNNDYSFLCTSEDYNYKP